MTANVSSGALQRAAGGRRSMAASDWDWRRAPDLQAVAWDCAATSLAWAMSASGTLVTEADVVAGLGPTRISPTYGLLDASGAGLVEYLGEVGITAQNNPQASYQELLDAAGFQPLVIGGRAWCHWVAVRMGGPAFGRPDIPELLLMNPSPGYLGVANLLDEVMFDELGPFSAVWFPA